MTDTAALDALIEAVEAGQEYLEREIQNAFGGYRRSTVSQEAIKAYHGDMNAAKALHEALLPEWGYVDLLSRGKRHTCRIARSVGEADFSAVSHDLALARLLATLKAHRASL